MYIYSARPELISSEYVRKLSGFETMSLTERKYRRPGFKWTT